jgi:hypothetical protein
VATLEKLAADYPKVPDYQSHLANSLTMLAATLRNSGKVVDSDDMLSRALGIHEALLAASPNDPAYRSRLDQSSSNWAALLVWFPEPPCPEAPRAVRSFTFSTAGWVSGSYTLVAVAEDSYGVLGDPASLTLQVV